jgi:glycosyltransferase involved in cell wall biosynthesis
MSKKIVLFYRDFKDFTGGHLKVWDYYRHLLNSTEFQPAIYFSKDSVFNPENPWFYKQENIVKFWNPQEADVLFLAGLDWIKFKECQGFSSKIPIVNLIQHVRHADPNDPRYRFLSEKALRICVSEAVSQSLHETNRVNGPIFTIPNGIDIDELPSPSDWGLRPIQVLIAGLKNFMLAGKLEEQLKELHFSVEVLFTRLPRRVFLDNLNRSKIAVLLPNETEGFYLPAIEAMALHNLVVCPDCRGNRSFCINEKNCFVPDYTLLSILQATVHAISINTLKRNQLFKAARETVLKHSLIKEKNDFLKIMQSLTNIW